MCRQKKEPKGSVFYKRVKKTPTGITPRAMGNSGISDRGDTFDLSISPDFTQNQESVKDGFLKIF